MRVFQHWDSMENQAIFLNLLIVSKTRCEEIRCVDAFPVYAWWHFEPGGTRCCRNFLWFMLFIVFHATARTEIVCQGTVLEGLRSLRLCERARNRRIVVFQVCLLGHTCSTVTSFSHRNRVCLNIKLVYCGSDEGTYFAGPLPSYQNPFPTD